MSTTTDEVQQSPAPARGLAAALDFAAVSNRRAALLLLAFCLLAFLPGFFQIPPVDRDEARFAQATKQMVERGEYVDIRFQDEVRYKKPIGIYWLQAVAVKAGEALGVPEARRTIWLYRLPSLLGATGAVLLTYWAALAFVRRRTALLAGLMMASSVLLGVEARLAKTDATLLMFCVAAMGAMARIYLSCRRTPERKIDWPMPALLWTAMAGGVLIKGPLILMFVGLTAVDAVDCRPLAALDQAVAAFDRLSLDAGVGVAVVHRHRDEVRRQLFRQSPRPRHAGQDRQRAGGAWRAAGILSVAVLGDVLARLGAGRSCHADDLEGAARARARVSCWPGWSRPGSCSKR